MSEQLKFPMRQKKSPLAVKQNSDLLIEVRRECKRRGLKITEAVEYGLKAFLEESKRHEQK